ncbi:tRNA (guanine-N1)-methyltransferase [Paucihalobacter sp.]|uniref:tRNA (guanine-N1)-methyltransferase n=1 Tax=Paucihalobacter sp. TaxID=2850405 RepID=UPI002FDF4BBE
MIRRIKIILLIFTVLFVGKITAQETTEDLEQDKLSLTEGTVENQFEYVIQRSNNYQDYKVVKKDWLIQLKAHVLDSLEAVNKDILKNASTIKNQEEEILNLKENLENTKNQLDSTVQEKDSMRLFGLQLSKTGYNVVMWSLIAGLLVLLIVFIFKFKSSNSITKNTNKKLLEIEDEFEEHRRTAVEREQKVRRQLQDELNKQKSGK